MDNHMENNGWAENTMPDDGGSPNPYDSFQPSEALEDEASLGAVDDFATQDDAVFKQEETAQAVADLGMAFTNFKAEKPDIDEAFRFLAENRDRQLAALGALDRRFQNQTMRSRQMESELQEIITLAKQTGQNPASFIYQLAVGHGYSNNRYYARLNAAQAASRSLTALPGRGATPVTMETLAMMPEQDFAKWYWKNRDTFRKIMGE